MAIDEFLNFERLEEAVKNGKVRQILDEDKIRNLRGDIDLFEIWYDGKSNKIVDLVLSYDSHELIWEFLDKDKSLMREIQKDFERTYENEGWTDWIINWLEERGWKVGSLGSDNTYNWDNWFGSVFEYVHFVGSKEGLIIMWHLGGDVRANYSYPEVWVGSREEIEDFFGVSSGDLKEEVSILLDYNDFSELEDDIEKIVSEIREGQKDLAEEHGQLRLFD